MSQIAITVKIDADLKNQIQHLAKNMGLSVSAIVENKLREVARDRRVVFEEELVPTEKFAKELREIEDDIRHGRSLSGPYDNVDDFFKDLENASHED